MNAPSLIFKNSDPGRVLLHRSCMLHFSLDAYANPMHQKYKGSGLIASTQADWILTPYSEKIGYIFFIPWIKSVYAEETKIWFCNISKYLLWKFPEF